MNVSEGIAWSRLIAAAQEVCEDHDLACEDGNGKIDRLREALDALKAVQDKSDG